MKEESSEEENEPIITRQAALSEIEKSREILLKLLMQKTISEYSSRRMIGLFNDYIVSHEENLPVSILSEQDDRYNWELMRSEIPNWTVIADIALRLLACPCSEASCERTISTQRLILASRRMKSTKRLLEARLTLMRAFE
jgi:hypothetical protein